MALGNEDTESDEPASSTEDHELNLVLGRLSPVILGSALFLILLGTVLQKNTVLSDGFVVLLAAPTIGILASVVTFLRQHDYRFVFVGLFVLLIIAISTLTGLHT